MRWRSNLARQDRRGLLQVPQKIGADTAVEALRNLFDRSRRPPIDDLWRYAEVDRVQTVIRPYLEALA
jgi:hypothetical protein